MNEAWTEWFNTDSPDGDGDIEPINLLHLGCSNPSAIQVETTNNIPYNETGQIVHLNSCFGFICLNKEQNGTDCLNYRIRQCCPVEELTTELAGNILHIKKLHYTRLKTF